MITDLNVNVCRIKFGVVCQNSPSILLSLRLLGTITNLCKVEWFYPISTSTLVIDRFEFNSYFD